MGVKITVTDVGGTYRDVADAARTTIGLSEGNKEVTEDYMYRMYKWVATHFERSKNEYSVCF